MPSQKTDAITISREKAIIRNLVGLSSSDEIILNDRGWDSRVYSFASDRYFFKFPRSEKIKGRYKYELAAIKLIPDLGTDLVVPKILWNSPDNSYFGYEGVQGRPLNSCIDTLSPTQIRDVGKSLGGFLSQLHTHKLSGARVMSIKGEVTQIQRWYQNCLQVIDEILDTPEQETLKKLVYEIWPSDLAKLGEDSVLCHGDLHLENILYSHDNKVGLIDFGDVAYYDRSKDFLELELNETLFDTVLEAYGKNDEVFLKKIAIRQNMIQVINLGFFFGKNDKDGIESTISKIKSYI